MLLSLCSITEYTVKIPISSDSQQDVANGFTRGTVTGVCITAISRVWLHVDLLMLAQLGA